MPPRNLQYCLEEKNGEEAYRRMPNGKLITLMQICLHCGGKLPFKQGRKSCPYCQGLLRTKTVILKAP